MLVQRGRIYNGRLHWHFKLEDKRVNVCGVGIDSAVDMRMCFFFQCLGNWRHYSPGCVKSQDFFFFFFHRLVNSCAKIMPYASIYPDDHVGQHISIEFVHYSYSPIATGKTELSLTYVLVVVTRKMFLQKGKPNNDSFRTKIWQCCPPSHEGQHGIIFSTCFAHFRWDTTRKVKTSLPSLPSSRSCSHETWLSRMFFGQSSHGSLFPSQARQDEKVKNHWLWLSAKKLFVDEKLPQVSQIPRWTQEDNMK